jgi:repressor LexA
MDIGAKIKQRRLELGWSQRELAKKMGYKDNTTLTKIERGLVDVSQSRVMQFSQVLDVSIAYLMDWEDEEKQKQSAESELSNQKKELIEKVMRMSDEELQKLDLLLQLVESK